MHNRPKKTYPRPPTELSEAALGEWQRCMRIWYQHDFIEELDRPLLAAYCQAYGRWAEAEGELKTARELEGYLVGSARGRPFPNPLIDVANVAMRDMVKFADMLGMTPMSRARIIAANAEPVEDIGKKEEQFREAQRVAGGVFAPSAPPRLVASNE